MIGKRHIEHVLTEDCAELVAIVDPTDMDRAGVPLMTGHHRRHNPLVQAVKQAIDGGRLGQVVSLHGTCWFYKPDSYFDIPWRREKGAGPVFLNLIHDVDLFRYLCSDVIEVQAIESNALRGNAVEETAREGLQALRVIEAVKQAAASGRSVRMG